MVQDDPKKIEWPKQLLAHSAQWFKKNFRYPKNFFTKIKFQQNWTCLLSLCQSEHSKYFFKFFKFLFFSTVPLPLRGLIVWWEKLTPDFFVQKMSRICAQNIKNNVINGTFFLEFLEICFNRSVVRSWFFYERKKVIQEDVLDTLNVLIGCVENFGF